MNLREIAAQNIYSKPYASAANQKSCELGTAGYYLRCGVGGILSCGLTHCAITPIDVVKCRSQADPIKYPNLVSGLKTTLAEEGVRGLGRGWAAALAGYSVQGLFKFGLYEIFKTKFKEIAGEEKSYEHRSLLYMAASASAEFFADIAYCPLEAVKVRIQTSDYSRTLRECLPKMYREEGLKTFWRGLRPLWLRQIPYTVIKFTCFERTLEALYNIYPKKRAEVTKVEQLGLTFSAGYIAGVFCAVVSHPADSVVSVVNKNPQYTPSEALKKLGMKGMWKGLLPRIFMIGTLTGAQWFIYDYVKIALNMPREGPPKMPESLKKKLAQNLAEAVPDTKNTISQSEESE